MSDKLTVVLLNWKRSENVRRFVAEYLGMPAVTEVIVWDASPEPHSQLPLQRFSCLTGLANYRYIRDYSDCGLPARFAAACLARTEHVLFVDDDIELPSSTVQTLLAEYRRNNIGVVGIFGRKIGDDKTYSIANHHGKVDIVLTRAAVTTRVIAAKALLCSVDMALALPDGQPFGNGEDIVLSYAGNRICRGRGNLALNLAYKNVGYDDQNAISVRFPGHEAHRSKVVQWCLTNIQ